MTITNYYKMFVTKKDGIELPIKNYNGDKFRVSKDYIVSTTPDMSKLEGTLDTKIFGIKSSLDIENEGSSKKAMDDLLEGKRKPESNDEQKFLNMSSIYEYIRTSRPTIDEDGVLVMYKMLCTNVDMEGKDLDGKYYRKGKGTISQVYETLDPKLVVEHMSDLIKYINNGNYSYFKAFTIMNQFVLIHPYYDFNGKMSRILLYWYMTLNNEEMLATQIIAGLNFDRDRYFKMLKLQREKVKNNLDPFMNYHSESMIKILLATSYIVRVQTKTKDFLTQPQWYVASYIAFMDEEVTTKDIMNAMKKFVTQGALSKILTKLVTLKYISVRKSTKQNVYKFIAKGDK